MWFLFWRVVSWCRLVKLFRICRKLWISCRFCWWLIMIRLFGLSKWLLMVFIRLIVSVLLVSCLILNFSVDFEGCVGGYWMLNEFLSLRCLIFLFCLICLLRILVMLVNFCSWLMKNFRFWNGVSCWFCNSFLGLSSYWCSNWSEMVGFVWKFFVKLVFFLIVKVLFVMFVSVWMVLSCWCVVMNWVNCWSVVSRLICVMGGLFVLIRFLLVVCWIFFVVRMFWVCMIVVVVLFWVVGNVCLVRFEFD